jgi:catechol 2,3-dioxygenase-like lactoylglutathione lyase family enzyme
MNDQAATTVGIDHVGLTVRDLEATRRFFCDCLGWRTVGERPSYPAVFVSDGQLLVTLWQADVQGGSSGFDRRHNVGLHHLALKVTDLVALKAVFDRVSTWPGVVVEFSPEPLGEGPKTHCMIYEPSGVRIEFACLPRIS